MRIATVFLALVAAPLGQVQEPFRLTIDVTLVSLDANVYDRSGNPVTSLKQEDFMIFEDGELQHIRDFVSAERPVSMLLLFHHAYRAVVLDGVSKGPVVPARGARNPVNPNVESAWNQLGGFLGEAITRVAGGLRETDRISIAAFDLGTIPILSWGPVSRGFPTEIVLPRGAAYSNLNPGPGFGGFGANLYAAADWAAGEVSDLPDRKIVVVITDGRDNRLDPIWFYSERHRFVVDPLFGSADTDEQTSLAQVRESITRSRARFYFITYGTDRNPDLVSDFGLTRFLREQVKAPELVPPYLERVRERLEDMAEASGGAVFYPQRTSEIGELASRVGRDASNAYSFTYSPQTKSSSTLYRRIEIRTRQPELKVRQSREGYSVK